MTSSAAEQLWTLLRDLVRAEVSRALAEARPVAEPEPEVAYLDDRAVAVLLSVSRETLQAWRKRGEGPPFVKLGRAVRYDRAAVVAWMDARTRGRRSA